MTILTRYTLLISVILLLANLIVLFTVSIKLIVPEQE